MTKVQERLLDALKWFDQLCRDNNLNYYLIGGTMLGAARHKGFIPWDDDIDVGMPRDDYDKLAAIMKNVKDKKYELETPDTEREDYYYPFSKLYDTTTTLIENTKYKIKRGIYIDIFPLDGIGNSFEESYKNYKKINRLFNFLLMRITGIRKGRKFYKNMSVFFMQLIPDVFVDNKKILKKLVSTVQKRSFYDYSYVGNLCGAWRYKEIMPKEYFGNPRKIMFEGIEIYGVEKVDEYLSSVYGDWKQLPPVEKQVSHHDFILLDLDKSYLE